MQFVRLSLLALALAASSLVLRHDAHAGTPTYNIGFYSMNSGGTTLRGRCYLLSGSLAQAAPGYASGSVYAQYAGFWTPAFAAPSLLPVDEIFFSAFEGC